jgi:hypothetical protein
LTAFRSGNKFRRGVSLGPRVASRGAEQSSRWGLVGAAGGQVKPT